MTTRPVDFYRQNNATVPRSPITGVPGWETAGEEMALHRAAAHVPIDGLIVEIGAEYGMSAACFADAADKSVRIVSLDLFPGDMLPTHQQNLARAGFAGRTLQIVGDSHAMPIPDQWTPDSVDLLFIDGDHSINGVKFDIARFLPLVKVDGRVAFHDCACQTNRTPHIDHFDVTKAVSEWYWQTGGAWGLDNMVDSLLIFQRLR